LSSKHVIVQVFNEGRLLVLGIGHEQIKIPQNCCHKEQFSAFQKFDKTCNIKLDDNIVNFGKFEKFGS